MQTSQTPVVIVKNVSRASFPFASALLFIFIVAKIFAVEPVAAWSWWWVFAPLWLPTAVILGLALSLLILAFMIAALVDGVRWLVHALRGDSKVERAMRDL